MPDPLFKMVNGERIQLTPQEEAKTRAEWAQNIADRPAKEAARKEARKEQLLNDPAFDSLLQVIAPKLSPSMTKTALRAQIKGLMNIS